jgi:hypothetical protein
VSSNSGRDPLEILSDEVLIAIPRGDDELRVNRTQARTSDGKIVSWIGIREWYRPEDSNEWRPGKKGITIKTRELEAVVRTLTTALTPSTAPRPTSRPAQRQDTFA